MNSFRFWLDTTALRFAAFEGVVVNEDTHPTKSDDTSSKRMAAAADDELFAATHYFDTVR
jgi:hypothetical protein